MPAHARIEWKSAGLVAALVAASSHKLKSLSRSAGGLALGGLCKRIERAVRDEEEAMLEQVMARFGNGVGATMPIS